MEREDLIWLSGLLEGEGCFGHDSHGRTSQFIRLRMTDGDVVARAAKLMGTTPRLEKWQRHPWHKRTWAAMVFGETARALMRELLPLMGERRSAKIIESLP